MKKIALLGAGAVGAYFIVGLMDKMGENFCLIAQGERKERLQKNGVDVNGTVYHPLVKEPEEVYDVDYLLIATKYTALLNCLDTIEEIVGPHTTVLSLLNGIESEETIGKRIGMEHMVYSFMKIASMNVDGKIVFDMPSTLGVYFGEAKITEPTPRLKELMELLNGTTVKYTFCENILLDMWKKYALNICRNLPQAIVGVGLGAYEDSEHVAYVSAQMREEVHAVARAKGIPLTDADYLLSTQHDAYAARYSTLQDLDAGRHTEIDIFSGSLVHMGAELGVPTPYNDMCYHLIKALEEKNDGKFNY